MDWRWIIKSSLVLTGYTFAAILGLKLRTAYNTIDNLHAAYPCKEIASDTTPTGDVSRFGMTFQCLDDRAVPTYSCGDGKCLYGCSCWEWKGEQERKKQKENNK